MARRRKHSPPHDPIEAVRLRAEEEELYERFRTLKTAEVFEEIMRKFHDYVYKICYTRLRSRADAEDATQEAFMALWKRRQTLNAPTLSAFLSTAARHAASERLRKRRKDPTSDEGLDEARAREELDPLELEDAHRLNHRIWWMVARMSVEDQQVIRTHYADGINSAALAKDVQLTAGAIRQRLARALGRLRELLCDAMPELFETPS